MGLASDFAKNHLTSKYIEKKPKEEIKIETIIEHNDKKFVVTGITKDNLTIEEYDIGKVPPKKPVRRTEEETKRSSVSDDFMNPLNPLSPISVFNTFDSGSSSSNDFSGGGGSFGGGGASGDF